MKDRKKLFFIVAIVCLVLSIIALFIPVISYKPDYKSNPDLLPETAHTVHSYSVASLVLDSDGFNENILKKYKGPVVWDIDDTITLILAATFILGIICAGFGVITLRVQHPNTWQFILTIAGAVLVTVPSVVFIVCVIGYGKYFPGTLSIGPAPIITIISMIVCIMAVIRRKNKVAEELKKELEAKGFIHKGRSLL